MSIPAGIIGTFPLIVAALSGVLVRLLLPEKGDSVLVNTTAEAFFEELLNAGVEIYRYQKGFVHAKTFVIDGQWASVGTANLEARSFDLNFEVSALVFDRAIATELRTDFYRDVVSSQKLSCEHWLQRPNYKQFIEKIFDCFRLLCKIDSNNNIFNKLYIPSILKGLVDTVNIG
nr:phospholipase D-like domain-containing protein [Capnocytophaga canimorsus]